MEAFLSIQIKLLSILTVSKDRNGTLVLGTVEAVDDDDVVFRPIPAGDVERQGIPNINAFPARSRLADLHNCT